MLTRLGFHKTVLIYSFIQGIVMLVGFMLIKTRILTSHPGTAERTIQWVDKKYFKDPIFWSVWSAILFSLL